MSNLCNDNLCGTLCKHQMCPKICKVCKLDQLKFLGKDVCQCISNSLNNVFILKAYKCPDEDSDFILYGDNIADNAECYYEIYIDGNTDAINGFLASIWSVCSRNVFNFDRLRDISMYELGGYSEELFRKLSNNRVQLISFNHDTYQTFYFVE